MSVTRGCVRLTLEMDLRDAEALLIAFAEGRLAPLNITSVVLSGETATQSDAPVLSSKSARTAARKENTARLNETVMAAKAGSKGATAVLMSELAADLQRYVDRDPTVAFSVDLDSPHVVVTVLTTLPLALESFRGTSYAGLLHLLKEVCDHRIRDLRRGVAEDTDTLPERLRIALGGRITLKPEQGPPDQLSAHIDAMERAYSLIDTLAPDDRTIVEMRLRGLTYDEIASTLKSRPQDIRTAYRRSINRLRQMINEQA
jgi:Sigma-70, region 4